MSSRPTPVAAVQLRAHDRSAFEQRWPEIVNRIAAAAESGARLIVAPEGTVPAYVIGMDAVDPQTVEAAARDLIAVAARTGATIVYGGVRPHAGGAANTAYVVTSAGIAGFADKFFLWHFDRRWFTQGDALQPIDTPVGRLGVFVCADGRIPTIASTLVARGAEILVVPTAWVTSGRNPQALENIQADLMIAVRARENGVPLVVANKVGVEARSVAYCGKSQIIAADGAVVAIASEIEETTLHGTVALRAALTSLAPEVPPVTRGTSGSLGATARIAITTQRDPALHSLAVIADANYVIDPHTQAEHFEIALADDEAVLDPRALIGPRLGGVRLFVWRASIDAAWVARVARTRAAELRAFVVALDTPNRHAFAVDPDGTVVCGTFDGYDIAAFTYDRARTDSWRVAPETDVREALLHTADVMQR